MRQLLGYRRVSSEEKGRSGVGLEGQTEAGETHARQTGSQIIAWYQEVESGKRHENRPELAKALVHAKRSGAILCVAKLDRLSRSLSLISQLQDAKTPFVCANMPEANELTLNLMACFA